MTEEVRVWGQRNKRSRSKHATNTAATEMVYEKYKLLSRYLSQQKLTKLTVPCNT